MAKQYGFLIDASRCTGCRTCEVACKDKNNLPVGRNFRHVLCFEGGGWRQDRATGAWHTDTFAYYVSVSCNQCEDPACVKVCPTKAHFKRKEDGLVLIDRDKCIGCGVCTAKCEFGAIKLHRERPECSNMIPSEKKLPYVLGNGAKQALKIKFSKKKEQ